MNKTELIDAVSASTSFTKSSVAAVINATLEEIQKANKKGDSVVLIGFGTFSVGKRAARTGRNPRDGKAIKIPASKYPKFKAGSAYKALVNGKAPAAKAAKAAKKTAKKK